jgi:paraquat-inducible protein A
MGSSISAPSPYLACPDCDGLFTAPETPEGGRVICPRCQAHLLTRRPDFVSHSAALVIAAAIFFVLANLFPFMTLQSDYRESGMLLMGSVTGLGRQGFPVLAGMVGIFMLGAPAFLMAAMLYLLLPLLQGRRLRWSRHLCRAMQDARRWNMVEVFLLGSLVSLLKLEKLATLTLGVSFWAFIGLIVCLASALSVIDQAELWRKLEEAQ